jgi:hypothetical protein
MSDLRRCPTCQEWKFFSHRCKPAWLVLTEDLHGTLTDWDEATKIRAFSHEEAATEFGEQYDRDDSTYPLTYGDLESIIVRVKPDFETGLGVKEFIVRGEIEPTYWAEEVKPSPVLGGFHASIDPSIPQGEIHMIDDRGVVVSRITGLGVPDA